MRRPILITLAALGGVIALIGSTNLHAVLSDTAHSGTNSIETGSLPASADPRLAEAAGDTLPPLTGITCGTFSDDLTSPLITVAGLPGFTFTQEWALGVRTVGSQAVRLSVQADGIDNIETACTGDESVYDTTCGAGPGELDAVTAVRHTRYDCSGLLAVADETITFSQHQQTPVSLGEMLLGDTACFIVAVAGTYANAIDQQAAQSDRLSWRFAWTGQV
jgi:hypothetical protein